MYKYLVYLHNIPPYAELCNTFLYIFEKIMYIYKKSSWIRFKHPFSLAWYATHVSIFLQPLSDFDLIYQTP